VATNEDGTFTLKLSPGTYAITGRSALFNDGQGRCVASTLVVGDTPISDVLVECPRK